MAKYAWPPTWSPNGFSMRLKPNLRGYPNAYTQQVDTVDLLGDVWIARIDLPPTIDLVLAGAREGFFDRLKGTANQIELWHLRKPRPLGTLRGLPVLSAAAAQLTNVISITAPTNSTLLTGDLIGLGGQLLRVVASAVSVAGVMVVEVAGRLRSAQPAGAAITWDRPKFAAMLTTADGVPVDYDVNGSLPISFTVQERA
jgi:hypothetical protein